MKPFYVACLCVCLAGSVVRADPPAGRPATPKFTADGEPVVREGYIRFVFTADDKKCNDGVRRPVIHPSYTLLADGPQGTNRYGFDLPRGGNRTIITVDGRQLLPEEALTYVANHGETGLKFRLVLTEAAPDSDPYKSWWRLEIEAVKKKRD